MKFYTDLMIKYGLLKFPSFYEQVAKIGKHISWYFADDSDQLVSCMAGLDKHIIEFDIKSAFPTICKVLFDNNSEFIKKMDSFTDKTEKLIHIATSLKPTGELHIINNICKLIIMGILFDSDEVDDILLLELKKDGAVIQCNDNTLYRLQHLYEINNEFTKFVLQNNFIFHTDFYNRYIRANRTSIFKQTDNVIFKGSYKYMPLKLKDYVNKILNYEDIDYDELLKVYSQRYFEIVKYYNIIEKLNEWFICENKKILNSDYKYEKYTRNINIIPRNYLQLFIYPSILSIKMENE